MSEQHRGGLKVTKEQAAIVEHVASHQLTVVDAGAGSGKTYCSTSRHTAP